MADIHFNKENKKEGVKEEKRNKHVKVNKKNHKNHEKKASWAIEETKKFGILIFFLSSFFFSFYFPF